MVLLPQTALVPLCRTCTVFPFLRTALPLHPFPLLLALSWTGFTAAALPPLLPCRTAALPSSLSLSCPCLFADTTGFLCRPQARGDAWLRSRHYESALGDRQPGDPWLGHEVMLGLWMVWRLARFRPLQARFRTQVIRWSLARLRGAAWLASGCCRFLGDSWLCRRWSGVPWLGAGVSWLSELRERRDTNKKNTPTCVPFSLTSSLSLGLCLVRSCQISHWTAPALCLNQSLCPHFPWNHQPAPPCDSYGPGTRRNTLQVGWLRCLPLWKDLTSLARPVGASLTRPDELADAPSDDRCLTRGIWHDLLWDGRWALTQPTGMQRDGLHGPEHATKRVAITWPLWRWRGPQARSGGMAYTHREPRCETTAAPRLDAWRRHSLAKPLRAVWVRWLTSEPLGVWGPMPTPCLVRRTLQSHQCWGTRTVPWAAMPPPYNRWALLTGEGSAQWDKMCFAQPTTDRERGMIG